MEGENRYEEPPLDALDVVARGLASGTMSRRRALKLVAAGGAAVLLSLLPTLRPAAKSQVLTAI